MKEHPSINETPYRVDDDDDDDDDNGGGSGVIKSMWSERQHSVFLFIHHGLVQH